MAEEEAEEVEGHPEEGAEPFGAVPTPDEIRENLRSVPRPTTPVRYDLTEAEFWRLRHIPAGSVLLFLDPRSRPEAPIQVAVLVTSTESLESGVWVAVKVVGSDDENAKKEAQRYFRSGKRRIHLCYKGRGDQCTVAEVDALHLQQFEWFPPGDFTAPWVPAQGRKLVRDGKTMALEEEKQAKEVGEERQPPEEDGRPTTSKVEERLRSLARPPALRPRVSFPGLEALPRSGRDDAPPKASSKAGPAAKAASSRSLVPYGPLESGVKKEIIDVDLESERRSKKKSKSTSLGESLARAARSHAEPKESERKKRKSRSRSRSRRSRRKRKKRRSSSDSRSRSRTASSSSEESLLPPLQRKAQRSPGAVFKMLEEHMAERLSQDAALELGEDGEGPGGSRPRFQTFFQLCLRPQLDSRSRDCKELSLLSRSLDLLRGGRLERLADLLAARLIAVDTATRQGWQTARYLEIDNEADEGSAPPHMLLAAQRHGRLVEKAGGKGSWPRQWGAYEWSSDSKGKSKGKDAKGKTKKGKSKGKGWKGPWQGWGADDRPKGGEGGAKKDGEK